nr:MAG TPA: hypothetical protein [Caudoviricetes sp.]
MIKNFRYAKVIILFYSTNHFIKNCGSGIPKLLI